jgi:hypothetical protein
MTPERCDPLTNYAPAPLEGNLDQALHLLQ